MKQKVASLIVCLVLSSFAAATQSTEWVTFSSLEGRFSVQFPKQPTPNAKEEDSAAGKMTLYSYAASSSRVSYLAAFSDYPTVFEPDRQKVVLDVARDDFARKLGAKIFEETKISINENPGRQFLMSKTTENGEELIYHWRIYLVGQRLYQVAASYYKRDSKSLEIPKYFDSFQLLN